MSCINIFEFSKGKVNSVFISAHPGVCLTAEEMDAIVCVCIINTPTHTQV